MIIRFPKIVDYTLRLIYLIGSVNAGASAELAACPERFPGTFLEGQHAVGVVRFKNEYIVLTNTGSVLRSQNGTLWTASEMVPQRSRVMIGVAATGENIAAIDSFGKIYGSNDTRNWRPIYVNETLSLRQIVSNGQQYLVVATRSGYGNLLLKGSSNAETWIERKLNDINPSYPIVLSSVGRKFFVSTVRPFWSADGEVFRPVETGGKNVRGHFAMIGQILVGLVNTRTIFASVNESDWTVIMPTTSDSPIRDVKAWRDKFIAVGDCGRILVGDTTQNWRMINSALDPRDRLVALAADNNEIIAVGESATPDGSGLSILVVTSSDAEHWRIVSDAARAALAQAKTPRHPSDKVFRDQ